MPIIPDQNTHKNLVITLGRQMNGSYISNLQKDVFQKANQFQQITFDLCLKSELNLAEIESLKQFQTTCEEQRIEFSIIGVSPKVMKDLVKGHRDFIDVVITE